MKLSKKEFEQLRRDNISVDAEKTKDRVMAAWLECTPRQKNEVVELLAVTRAAIRNAGVRGVVSLRTAVALAQTLNRNPLYFTGETDEPGICSDEALTQALKKGEAITRQAAKPAAAPKQNARKARPKAVKRTNAAPTEPKAPSVKPKAEPKAAQKAAPAAEAKPKGAAPPQPRETAPAPVSPPFLDDITEEEMILLMRSILLRAKAGGKNAALAKQLKTLLLS